MQVWLAVLFSLGTILTTLQANNVPVLLWLVDPYHIAITQQVCGTPAAFLKSYSSQGT